MVSTEPSVAPRQAWRTVVRVLVTFGVLTALGYWLFLALVLALLKCDESCSGGQADYWGYPGQLVLASAGFLLAAVGLLLGFTSRRGGSRACLWGAAATVLVWVVWVIGFGSF